MRAEKVRAEARLEERKPAGTARAGSCEGVRAEAWAEAAGSSITARAEGSG